MRPGFHVLSPRQLADAIGVSESSIKRWVDDGRIPAVVSTGGHRRIPMRDAVRFIRQEKYAVVRPDLLGLASRRPLPEARELDRVDLIRPLLDGDAELTAATVMSLYLAGHPLGAIFDGPVRLAMHHVGELWLHDADGIFLEHRATDIIVQCINHIRGLLRPPAGPAFIAAGAAPSGDPYLIPTLMAATVLADLGMRAVNLGPQTPLDSLARACLRNQAALVWLSVSLQDPPPALRRQIIQLDRQLHEADVRLVLGGRTLPELRLPDTLHGRSLDSMESLVYHATRMLPR